MLTSEPTAKMIEKWKRIFAETSGILTPNRKSGVEVDKYFRENYAFEEYSDPVFTEVTEFNAMSEYNAEKLKVGEKLCVVTYKTDEVLIGIDLATGFFHIESENTDRAAEIYDDLFVYRGLDEADLKNFFLVAQYVELKSR